MPEPSNIRVRIVGATDVGLVREHNEDNYLIIDLDSGEADFSHLREYDLGKRGALLVVCDGMGGAAAGEVASQMAVQSMRQQLLPAPTPAPAVPSEGGVPPPAEPPISPIKDDKEESEFHQVARRLREAAQRANQEIYEAACADIAKAGMGTTLTALMLLHSHVVVAQVGDSRAYLWRQGKLTQITHDQSLVNQLLDSGQITPEQAKLFEHSNVILQALGVQEDIEVVLSSETLRRDDRLLLCSDGLVGVVSDEEIQEVVASVDNLEEGVQRLIDMARAGGGPDNITVILAQAYGDGLVAPAPEDQAQYRAMALDGDKPQERRTWSADYTYAGNASPGREASPSSASSGRLVSPVSLLSMAAVLALAVTGLVVGLVLYPQRTTPSLVTCSVAADQPGLQVMVDDKVAASLAGTTGELKLLPGEHRLWLSNPQDGARRSDEQSLLVTAGQHCEASLHGLAAVVPQASALDAAPADGPRGPGRDGGVADAGSETSAIASVDAGEPEPEPPSTGPEVDVPGHPKIKRHKHRGHDKPADLGTAGAPSGGTEPPAVAPELATPVAKPESKPVEPSPADKPIPDKPVPPPADKPPADKPAADKPPADKPPADKPLPAAEKPTPATAPEKPTP
jgi:serine/threonine protein phosphatase PrpC